jgi:hypothetical protein
MFETLYLFLARYKQLCLPGIGVVSLEITPAKTKFVDRAVLPPEYSFRFSPAGQPPGNKLFHWIAYHLDISESEASAKFNEFISDVKNQLEDGKKVFWQGVGNFSKGLMNEIEFESVKNDFLFQQPVLAEKVIRENAKHVVVVGEREKTGSDISEILAEPEVPGTKTVWWIWPVVLIVLSLFFIGWYFSENGVKASSSSNTEKSVPKDAPQGFNFNN